MAEEPSSCITSSVPLQQQFHANHGTLVQLSENGFSAFRLRPSHEFNQGLVFSSRSLKDEQVFEVRIDRKVLKLLNKVLPDFCNWNKNLKCAFLFLSRFTHGQVVYKLELQHKIQLPSTPPPLQMP